jgi:hypothetical protein
MPDCHQPFISDLRRSVHQRDRKELTLWALGLHEEEVGDGTEDTHPKKTELADCFFRLLFPSPFASLRARLRFICSPK